jgi:hypothetical protein
LEVRKRRVCIIQRRIIHRRIIHRKVNKKEQIMMIGRRRDLLLNLRRVRKIS